MTVLMAAVLTQNEKYLFDRFGSPLRDGACVLDADHEVGYVRFEFGTRRGPDSAYWDGWFCVTRTRDEHPLRGKLANRSAGPAHRDRALTWNTVAVSADRLAALLEAIRATGGTIISCRPEAGCRVAVTWTTPAG